MNFKIALLVIILVTAQQTSGYELIGYWGQSDGYTDYSLDTAAFDIYAQINIAFVTQFPDVTCTVDGTQISYVGMDLAGNCGDTYNGCSNLLTCSSIGTQIQARQQKGQRILISLGGDSGTTVVFIIYLITIDGYSSGSSSSEAIV
jgi:hypothetical protein